MAAEQFTLHRRAWRLFTRLPRLVRVWVVLAAIAALIKIAFLTGSDREQPVRVAVAGAVRAALGPDPGSSCPDLSPAGLRQVLADFGGGAATGDLATEVAECRQLVVRLRGQATAQQLADFGRGSVRAVQFRPDGSALVVYLAADRRLGAELIMARHAGRWLIDSVSGGEVAGAAGS